MDALKSLLAENNGFVRKMYNEMDTVLLEFFSMRDTLKKSLDLIVQDLKEGQWEKFHGTISVLSLNTFMHGESNSLDVFVNFGNYQCIN